MSLAGVLFSCSDDGDTDPGTPDPNGGTASVSWTINGESDYDSNAIGLYSGTSFSLADTSTACVSREWVLENGLSFADGSSSTSAAVTIDVERSFESLEYDVELKSTFKKAVTASYKKSVFSASEELTSVDNLDGTYTITVPFTVSAVSDYTSSTISWSVNGVSSTDNNMVDLSADFGDVFTFANTSYYDSEAGVTMAQKWTLNTTGLVSADDLDGDEISVTVGTVGQESTEDMTYSLFLDCTYNESVPVTYSTATSTDKVVAATDNQNGTYTAEVPFVFTVLSNKIEPAYKVYTDAACTLEYDGQDAVVVGKSLYFKDESAGPANTWSWKSETTDLVNATITDATAQIAEITFTEAGQYTISSTVACLNDSEGRADIAAMDNCTLYTVVAEVAAVQPALSTVVYSEADNTITLTYDTALYGSTSVSDYSYSLTNTAQSYTNTTTEPSSVEFTEQGKVIVITLGETVYSDDVLTLSGTSSLTDKSTTCTVPALTDESIDLSALAAVNLFGDEYVDFDNMTDTELASAWKVLTVSSTTPSTAANSAYGTLSIADDPAGSNTKCLKIATTAASNRPVCCKSFENLPAGNYKLTIEFYFSEYMESSKGTANATFAAIFNSTTSNSASTEGQAFMSAGGSYTSCTAVAALKFGGGVITDPNATSLPYATIGGMAANSGTGASVANNYPAVTYTSGDATYNLQQWLAPDRSYTNDAGLSFTSQGSGSTAIFFVINPNAVYGTYYIRNVSLKRDTTRP